MKRKLMILGLLALVTCGILSSCKKDSSEQQGGTAKLNVHLTDGPADYDAIFIDVQRVEIHSDVSGWVSVAPVVPGVYNLLDFSNGLDTLLCAATLPAGSISQMRLVLGNNNSIVVNGTSHPLSTPSAQQSGLKFNIHEELAVNGSYDIWIDFDAGKSIVEHGNGDYSLKPVIRTYTALTNGKIKGFVLPLSANAVVYAINGADTFSAIPAVDGHFLFCGLPQGTYSLWVDAGVNTGLQDWLQANVTVTFGTITDVGVITLLP
jgi:hypothetical protein